MEIYIITVTIITTDTYIFSGGVTTEESEGLKALLSPSTPNNLPNGFSLP